MKFLAEAQVAVLVTALLLGLGTISTCAVVLGTTDDSDRPEWIDPALGIVPLAVALLAWAGALGVYIVACLLARLLEDATWIVSVRADVFLLSAFLLWGIVANICMTVAVGLSVDSRIPPGPYPADQAGIAAAAFTWIIILMLTLWLAIEICYVKIEYGRLAAVWSQSLRVLTPERIRPGGINLVDPPERSTRTRVIPARPVTYPVRNPRAEKNRPVDVPVQRHADGYDRRRTYPTGDRERDAEYERERHERRERRRIRRERRERREQRRREREERSRMETEMAVAEAEHRHRNGEHCPTCGSHSQHWEPTKAAPTSPLRPAELADHQATHQNSFSSLGNAVAGPSKTHRKASPPLPPLPKEPHDASPISPISPRIEPLCLPPTGFSMPFEWNRSTEVLESPGRHDPNQFPLPETRGSTSNGLMDYYNDRLSHPTIKSLKSLKSTKSSHSGGEHRIGKRKS